MKTQFLATAPTRWMASQDNVVTSVGSDLSRDPHLLGYDSLFVNASRHLRFNLGLCPRRIPT